jgi:hypothetical protein
MACLEVLEGAGYLSRSVYRGQTFFGVTREGLVFLGKCEEFRALLVPFGGLEVLVSL